MELNGKNPHGYENRVHIATREVIAQTLGYIDVASVQLRAKLREDLGEDSIDRIELCFALEERFEIDVDQEDAEAWETVEDVATAVAKMILVQRGEVLQ